MILAQMTTAYPVGLPAQKGWSFISLNGILILFGIAVVISLVINIIRGNNQKGLIQTILDAIFVPVIALIRFIIGLVKKCTGNNSFIAFGILAVYFLGLNIEGYYLALGNGKAFIPIPFVETNADIENLFTAINTDFWRFVGACVFSVCVQAYQAWALRDPLPEVAKKRYEKAAKYKVPPVPGDSLDVTAIYHSRYKSSGLKMELSNMVGLSISWLIDISVAIQKYPLFPFNSKWIGIGDFVLAITLIIITVLGSEIALAGYQRGEDEYLSENSGVARVPNP